jgi:hypothetical protein
MMQGSGKKTHDVSFALVQELRRMNDAEAAW